MTETKINLEKRFFLGGKATFTVEPSKAAIDGQKLKPHYTYRINRPKPKQGDTRKPPFFVSGMTGPENTANYSYLGLLDPETGTVRLTVRSITTGVGPECEVFVKGGFDTYDDVPQLAYRQVALIQAAYWMQDASGTLDALKDACLDAYLSDERAEQIVNATRACMRKFKKGKNWPALFRDLVA